MQPAPKAHQEFVTRFPGIGKAWDLLQQAGGTGPLDERTQRLVKLAISIGALREGAVHSAVRKARGAGCTREEMEQVVALAASTIGLPGAVAVHTWIKDELEG
jgi:alkylhydroperoxidase/carboxymuconolactone decarboxylase family protein YurZ